MSNGKGANRVPLLLKLNGMLQGCFTKFEVMSANPACRLPADYRILPDPQRLKLDTLGEACEPLGVTAVLNPSYLQM